MAGRAVNQHRNQQNWRLINNPPWRSRSSSRRHARHRGATRVIARHARHRGATHVITAPRASSRHHTRHRGATHAIAAPHTSRSHVRHRGATHTSSRRYRYGLHRGARHGAPKTSSSTLRNLRHPGTNHVTVQSRRHSAIQDLENHLRGSSQRQQQLRECPNNNKDNIS